MSRPFLLLNVTVPLTVVLLLVALGVGVGATFRHSPRLRVGCILRGILAVLTGGVSSLLGLTIP